MFWQEIHRADQQLTLMINSWDSSLTAPVWQFFSNIPIWIPMYVGIIALIIWRLGWKRGLLVVAAAVLTFTFCDQFSNMIKNLVCRVRPLNDPYMLEHGLNVLEKGSKSFSFFSAHSANAFGLATSTYLGLRLDKRLKYKGYAIWMYSWATLVAVSRIFVGKHYLGDCIVGSVIGFAAGLLFVTIVIRTIRRWDIK